MQTKSVVAVLATLATVGCGNNNGSAGSAGKVGSTTESLWAPNWTSFGGTVASGPAVTLVPGSNRADVFVRGSDNKLWHFFKNGGLSGGWDNNAGAPPVPGGLMSRPAAFYQASSPAGDRWHIVGLGSDNSLYYTYYQLSSGWKNPWLKIPNGVLTTGASISDGGNHLDIWAAGQGPLKQVWHTFIYTDQITPVIAGTWEGSAGAPTSPSGVNGAPTAFSRAPGQVDIVVQSADDLGLWHRNYDGSSWSTWSRLGSFWDGVTVEPALSSLVSGRLDVWARGSDAVLYHTNFPSRQPGGTVPWDAGAGSPTGGLKPGFGVAAATPQGSIADVFGVGSTSADVQTRRYYDVPLIASVQAEARIASVASIGDGFLPKPYLSDPAAPLAPEIPPSVVDWFFEDSAIAIPPNGLAPSGGCPATARVVAGVGQYSGNLGTAAILRTDGLAITGKTLDVTNGLYDATGLTPWNPSHPYLFGTDQIITRAAGGEIVHVRLGYNDNNVADKNGNAFVWRSRDCGATWTGFHIPNQGMDRVEVYADPWSSMVYLAAGKGVAPVFQKMNLSAGSPIFSNVSYSGMLSGAEPLMMTSTQSGRLFVLQCPGGVPTITYTPRGFDGSGTVALRNVSLPGTCGEYDRGGGFSGSLSVTRVGSGLDGDSVRVAFPFFADENGKHRQKVRVLLVRVAADGLSSSTSEASGSPIQSATGSGSVWQVTAVESDRIELPANDATNTALYYWQESTDSPAPADLITTWGAGGKFGTATVNGLLVRDADLTGARVRLSSSTSLMPYAGGDYMKGGFFFDPANRTKLNFLAIWTMQGYLAGSIVTTTNTL